MREISHRRLVLYVRPQLRNSQSRKAIRFGHVSTLLALLQQLQKRSRMVFVRCLMEGAQK
jgi:hypothetical protein